MTLAELVATLSLVADLGIGRPMERVLRQTVVAVRLGAAAGMDRAACSSAYYTSLLTWVGCAVDTAGVAALFGDETELYADTRDGDLGFPPDRDGREVSGIRGPVGAADDGGALPPCALAGTVEDAWRATCGH